MLRVARGFVYGTAAGCLGCAAYDVYRQDERGYRGAIMPAVQGLMNGEAAHRLGVIALHYKLFPKSNYETGPELRVKLWDLDFGNCVGVAAGFDKHGECIEGLARVGFGFVEVGSVTPLPQPGNEKPRVFRLQPDMAVINRYGFNSIGHDAAHRNIDHYLHQEKETSCVLGINLGKNKTSPSAVEDYCAGVKKFVDQADYLVINISSPNTPGLRNLQAKKELDELISNVVATRDQVCANSKRKVPLLLKIAPDLSMEDKQDIAEVVLTRKVDGIIATNTTIERPKTLESVHREEIGGLSGRPVKNMSTQVISDMYRLTKGKVPIIGVGGIECGRDAFNKIKAGASLVQVYSAMTYQGPVLAKRVQRELTEILQREGYASVQDAVGTEHAQK